MFEEAYLFTYPMDRLLAKPMVFSYIEENSGVPHEVLSDSFYTLFEITLEDIEGDEDSMPEYVQFKFHDDGFEVAFNTGQTLYMEKSPGGVFQTSEELGTSFEVNSLLMSKLRDVVPEDWKDDFGLDKIPTPENNFLSWGSAECFKGEIYRLSNPEDKLSFVLKYLGEEEFDVQIGES